MSYDSVLGAIDRGVARSVNWGDFIELKVIGMDEIALRKGHRDFVVIVTLQRDDDDIALLGVLPDRKKETVVAFLRLIQIELRASIDRVCTSYFGRNLGLSFLIAIIDPFPENCSGHYGHLYAFSETLHILSTIVYSGDFCLLQQVCN
jgi:hypothetical protein